MGEILTLKDGKSECQDICLVCGSSDQRVMFPADYFGSAADAVSYFLAHRAATSHGRIVRCNHCGFTFTSPRFTEAEYDRIYKSIAPPMIVDQAFEAAKTARLARLARLVSRRQSGRANLLDFGCGDGTFLAVLNSPTARGFEIGLGQRRFAGQSEILTGNWSEVACSPEFPAGSIDTVVAFDVLEHLPRIDEDVTLIREVLKPGGLFFATAPNIDSRMARLMGSRWAMLLLEHLWYFSPSTLRDYLAKHGFEMIEWRGVPYDAPLGHLATRLAQVFRVGEIHRLAPFSKAVLPIPAGLMLGVFRRR